MHFYQIFKKKFLVDQRTDGVVFAMIDKETKAAEGKKLAVKKFENTFEHKLYAKRALREMKILRLMSHENVIVLLLSEICVIIFLDHFSEACFPSQI